MWSHWPLACYNNGIMQNVINLSVHTHYILSSLRMILYYNSTSLYYNRVGVWHCCSGELFHPWSFCILICRVFSHVILWSICILIGGVFSHVIFLSNEISHNGGYCIVSVAHILCSVSLIWNFNWCFSPIIFGVKKVDYFVFILEL
jgi:hypothetical protein